MEINPITSQFRSLYSQGSVLFGLTLIGRFFCRCHCGQTVDGHWPASTESSVSMSKRTPDYGRLLQASQPCVSLLEHSSSSRVLTPSNSKDDTPAESLLPALQESIQQLVEIPAEQAKNVSSVHSSPSRKWMLDESFGKYYF